MENVITATKLTRSQVANAITQLRMKKFFPEGSKWYGRKAKAKPVSISVTHDEIETIAAIGIVKTQEILRLLIKLGTMGC